MTRLAVSLLACLATVIATSTAKSDGGRCHWAGTAPFCRPHGCPRGYAIAGGDPMGGGHRCWSGIKYLCCKAGSKAALSAKQRNGCFWSGTAPLCRAACPPTYRSVRASRRGDGKRCSSGYKLRCCPVFAQ